MSKGNFEPKIIGLFCKWCTSAAADLAGTSRKTYPANVVPIRFFCSSRIDPQHVLHAFKNGADGVLIGGCHFGDCHYQNGNEHAMERVEEAKKFLELLGINPRRVRLEWVSASEGIRFKNVIEEFTQELIEMGPAIPK